MKHLNLDDTIVAIASMPGQGLRGIVRISGDDCLSLIERLFAIDWPSQNSSPLVGAWAGATIKPASIELNCRDGDPLRLSGHLIRWPIRSFTGQPAAEFHTLAATPLLELVLTQLCQSGARLAQPGEFTLRAFLSGRIDLPQAEAVLATIDARSSGEFEVALKQLAGGLSGPVADAAEQLKWILAELEAGLDFVEEDIEFINAAEIASRLNIIQASLLKIIQQIDSRYQRDANLKAVLTGLPNSGKSSLFNELLGQTKAIVSSQSGTTTDYLAGRIAFSDYSIELIDTAGVEGDDHLATSNTRQKVAKTLAPPSQSVTESVTDSVTDSIADFAQQQRQRIGQQATLTLLCCPLDGQISAWELQQFERLTHDSSQRSSTILVFTRADLAADSTGVRRESFQEILEQKLREFPPTIRRACGLMGEGQIAITSIHDEPSVDQLRQKIATRSGQLFDAEVDLVGSTVARTGESLRHSCQSIAAALEAVDHGWGEEIVAAEIRLALDELGLVVGTVYNDDILDLVFSRFCIGK